MQNFYEKSFVTFVISFFFYQESRRRLSSFEWGRPESATVHKQDDAGTHLNPSTSVDIPPSLSSSNPAAFSCLPDSASPLHSLPQSRTWMGNPFGETSEQLNTTSPTTVHNPSNFPSSLSAPQINPFYQNTVHQQMLQRQTTGLLSPNTVTSPSPISPLLSPVGLFPTNDLFSQDPQRLSQSLESYSVNLLRTQLDQAQQQAQVIFFLFICCPILFIRQFL